MAEQEGGRAEVFGAALGPEQAEPLGCAHQAGIQRSYHDRLQPHRRGDQPAQPPPTTSASRKPSGSLTSSAATPAAAVRVSGKSRSSRNGSCPDLSAAASPRSQAAGL